MSLLNQLPPVKSKPKRRLGRGYGSQKGGHTSSRGQKGQKSRNKLPIWFEGGQLPLIRRTPFIKGKSRFNSLKPKPVTITLDELNAFKANSTVDLKSLSTTLRLSSQQLLNQGAKILASGQIKKALIVKVPASKTAAKAIQKAGGRVE
ncbi:50S ribosomal protein L15 [Candidatus Chazhemtobacterium aquaticus]|jgi:large subunit ribosomal protein L15|uniref:Large ribosomal subunit protein uL15 n=1 Tax=Candidatus Chazhemtobacterium aquaticus TaxID=2715735 RepID=A0A857N4Z1_9BACT|nr:50S ribosomal protein L15 [Candidatus Chazhemtobacterium aquaticus]QHO63305.1 LSU ribosomal protein L15p (L27Ae) [Candidatus Chazhemtobacterium aquaticus]